MALTFCCRCVCICFTWALSDAFFNRSFSISESWNNNRHCTHTTDIKHRTHIPRIQRDSQDDKASEPMHTQAKEQEVHFSTAGRGGVSEGE